MRPLSPTPLWTEPLELDPEAGCESTRGRTDARDVVDTITAQLPAVIYDEEDQVSVCRPAK